MGTITSWQIEQIVPSANVDPEMTSVACVIISGLGRTITLAPMPLPPPPTPIVQISGEKLFNKLANKESSEVESLCLVILGVAGLEEFVGFVEEKLKGIGGIGGAAWCIGCIGGIGCIGATGVI